MNFALFFKHRKNKILAILFVGLALAGFLAGVIVNYVGAPIDSSGLTFSVMLDVVYFVFEGGILTYLLVTNIRNDPRAYMAILMWIFWFFLGEIQTLFFSTNPLWLIFNQGVDPLTASLLIWYFLLVAGSLGVGIALYIFVRRYMFHIASSFRRIRLLSIIYASLSALTLVIEVVLSFQLYGGLIIVPTIIFAASRAFADVGIVFTLERLRR